MGRRKGKIRKTNKSKEKRRRKYYITLKINYVWRMFNGDITQLEHVHHSKGKTLAPEKVLFPVHTTKNFSAIKLKWELC